jgi:hypothetical protein
MKGEKEYFKHLDLNLTKNSNFFSTPDNFKNRGKKSENSFCNAGSKEANIRIH